MVTAVSGQLDTPGSYRVFDQFRLRTSNAVRCPTYHRTKEEDEALDWEIAELITKKAVEEVDFCQARFVSPMFIAPKKGGKWRPVLNLQSLNQHVSRTHFKLKVIRSLKDILRQGDFMAKLDLIEAYFLVPIDYQSRSFLQFLWKDNILQFTCLPFGSRCDSKKCPVPTLEDVNRLCFPPFCMKASAWSRSPRKKFLG